MSNCYLCQKSYKQLYNHLKNYHKWSKDEIKQYKMDAKQQQTSAEKEEEKWSKDEINQPQSGTEKEEDMSRYASRQISWTEFIQNGEARAELTNVTAQRFRQMNEILSSMYWELHSDALRVLLSLPSGPDIVDGRKDVDDNVRKILKPSMAYLEQVNNVEMIRLASQLQKEIY